MHKKNLMKTKSSFIEQGSQLASNQKPPSAQKASQQPLQKGVDTEKTKTDKSRHKTQKVEPTDVTMTNPSESVEKQTKRRSDRLVQNKTAQDGQKGKKKQA